MNIYDEAISCAIEDAFCAWADGKRLFWCLGCFLPERFDFHAERIYTERFEKIV
jgi:hypothetical protein